MNTSNKVGFFSVFEGHTYTANIDARYTTSIGIGARHCDGGEIQAIDFRCRAFICGACGKLPFPNTFNRVCYEHHGTWSHPIIHFVGGDLDGETVVPVRTDGGSP